jgi:hypothetical protein
VYGGAQGVWVNSKRIQALDDRGLTVGVLHAGLHYADDFTDKDVLYHYPRTNRPPGRDRPIEATKAAGASNPGVCDQPPDAALVSP